MSVGSIGGSISVFAGRFSQSGVRGANAQQPQIPDEMKSKIDSILQSGGSMQEVKSSLDAAFEEFKNSDSFQQLPQEMRDMMEKMRQSGPPPGGDQGPMMMQHLEQLGGSTKASLLSQFNAGDTSELQSSLLELIGKGDDAS